MAGHKDTHDEGTGPGDAGAPETGLETRTPAQPVRTASVGSVYTKKKRKKRRYSRGLKDVQNLERGLTRASKRISRALDRGLSRYIRLRDRSSRRKRDGAIRDVLKNASRALGRGLRAGSNAPYDLIRDINTKRFSRRLRDTVRYLTPPLFR